MSKIIKSEQCVEAHPCRLQPVDMDAFFINEEVSSSETTVNPEEENISESANEEPVDDSKENAISTGELGDGAVTVETASQDELFLPEETNPTAHKGVTRMLDLESISLEPSANNGKAIPSLTKETVSSAQNISTPMADSSENINLDHLANLAETIDSLISGAQEQAGTIAEDARRQAGSVLEGASLEARSALERAKFQAEEITTGAKGQVGNIITGANKQAETIMNMAKEQSDLILEGARLQSAKAAEKAKHQTGVIIETAKKQAGEIIEEAKQQAEIMLKEAAEQSVALKEQAYQEGLQTGHQAAVNEVKQELEKDLTQALSLLNEIEMERMERLASSESELLKLAVHIAEKIIGDTVKLEPTTQREIVRVALARITTAQKIKLRIHPDDLEIMKENLAVLQSSFSEPKPISFEGDSSISQGSCFIETDHGNVDARVKSQLERILHELLKIGQIQ